MAGKKTHGLSKHPLYNVWFCMKERCNNPNSVSYPYYGYLGVSVCEEWENDFVTFFEWAMSNNWEKGLQIDRIDASKDYCPDNCSIVTKLNNIIHRRKIKPKSSIYKGVYWRKSRNKWEATIRYNKKSIFLGRYLDEKEAAKAYDKKALELYGEFAQLNFTEKEKEHETKGD